MSWVSPETNLKVAGTFAAQVRDLCFEIRDEGFRRMLETMVGTLSSSLPLFFVS